MLINKIGDDINDANMDGPYIKEFSSNHKENGFMDFQNKTEGSCNEYT